MSKILHAHSTSDMILDARDSVVIERNKVPALYRGHILQRDPDQKNKNVYKILSVSENCMKKIKLYSITETDWKHMWYMK